ncbi:MAG: molybdenum-dependent transcriptional regulator [Phenylobacterium sp.]|uniref:TOBE domain-containing protein n=1 Tax=Phenylobacterium sp. TaxID=1871053 RepID=UPI0025F86C73|nr:TOBE domain-containing protein [Phenylobacterium sp.]MBA4012159.1 molybdenum-dependent transcriptional regulator [Phenylobacterium sp.]
MSADGSLDAALFLRRGASRVGAERIALLEAVAELGSISAAAKRLGLSYKGAWDGVQALNNLFDAPLIAAQPGGRSGGAAQVTDRGRAVIAAFHKVEAELAAALVRIEAGLGGDELGGLFWSLGMKTSARNALRGVVSDITPGAVNSEVTLKVADGVDIVSVVTRQSVEDLGLAVGKPAIALIKSSFVVLAKGEGLVTSARNQLRTRVLRREDGAVSSEISLELADGKTLVATITRESAEIMQLAAGDAVTALVKAPHVILAVE